MNRNNPHPASSIATATDSPIPSSGGGQTRLFVACIIALVSVAFGFIITLFLINEWKETFNLDDTGIGSIQGAGLFPQALTIILFSFIADRVGYGRIIAFAWVGRHIGDRHNFGNRLSGTLLGHIYFALANGAVEAVINPVTATLYPKKKTHYLNILHAGWPGGLVIGGALAIILGTIGGADAWKWKVAALSCPDYHLWPHDVGAEISGARTCCGRCVIHRYAQRIWDGGLSNCFHLCGVRS